MISKDRVIEPAQSLSDLVEQAMDHFGECDTVIAAGGDKMEAALNRLGICQLSLVVYFSGQFIILATQKKPATTIKNGLSG